MDAKPLIEKITEDARQAAAQILQDARERAETLRAQADARLKERTSENQRQAAAQAEELAGRMARMAQLEDRKALLQKKREVLDAAFAKASGDLRALSPQQAREFFLAQLAQLAQGDEEVAIGQNSPYLDAAFIAQANSALAGQGKPGNLRLAAQTISGSGFVLRRAGAELNRTFEKMVDSLRTDLEGDVARILFEQ